MRQTITITYTCHRCGLIEQDLDVPERHRAVDLDLWIERAVNDRIAEDHDRRSPHCSNDEIALTIPIAPNTRAIGRRSE